MTRIHLGTFDDGAAATLPLSRLNRHVLVTGSTGSGKTVTLERLAHEIARAGVPVVFPDVKGDLAGRRVPLSMSVSGLGPDLMARALGLTDAQTGVLETVDRWARETRRDLDTLDDFRRGVVACIRSSGWTRATMQALDRALLRLERSEGVTFGRAFDPLTVAPGEVATPDAVALALSPGPYGAACLGLLEGAYRRLPEIGDAAKPRLVVVIDEAHMLFRELPPLLLSRVETLIRLLRSRGVGVVLASQSVDDLPSSVVSQLGTRVQHGLRAASRADLAGLRTAADTLPGSIDPATVRTLPTGRALVSVVELDGSQTVARVARIDRPRYVQTVARGLPRSTDEPSRPSGDWFGSLVALLMFGLVLFVTLR